MPLQLKWKLLYISSFFLFLMFVGCMHTCDYQERYGIFRVKQSSTRSLTRAVITLENLRANEEKQVTLDLSNVGIATIRVLSVEMQGKDNHLFRLDTAPQTPFELNATPVVLNLSISPKGPGTYTSSILITSENALYPSYEIMIIATVVAKRQE